MKTGLRAIMVCVDYQDILALTLPHNFHHFDEVTVVTAPHCLEEVGRVCYEMRPFHRSPSGKGITVLGTDLFYAGGARFNKWAALEWGLDQMGRTGWLCVMDADVMWPKDLVVRGEPGTLRFEYMGTSLNLPKSYLCTPHRRMFPTLPREAPPEAEWRKYPVHRNVNEFAGYSQIFHGSDPVLGPAPWHQVDWTHAGGADSFFQQKWKPQNKVRPPFEVLHLGEAGVNWMGRATPLVDGTVLEGAEQRRRELRIALLRRKQAPAQRRFDHEKIPPSPASGGG